jgi:hypothetical protein
VNKFLRISIVASLVGAWLFCGLLPGPVLAQGETETVVFNTTGNFTFTVPAGAILMTVEAWGGGGGGGGHPDTSNGGGGGGGGGAYARATISVTGGDTYNVTVGEGGAGGPVGYGGSPGGDSRFYNAEVDVVLAAGGVGGGVGPGGVGGAGGAANTSVGDVIFSGGNGGDGNAVGTAMSGGGGGGAGNESAGGNAGNTTAGNVTGGIGGNYGGGNGGDGVSGAGAGSNGTALGGGGGGACRHGAGAYAGGDGARGEVIVTYAVGSAIVGETREVNCNILGNVTVTLYQGAVTMTSTVSDVDGNYELVVSEFGVYNVTASADGFRDVTRAISVTENTTYTVDFVGDYGLIPNAVDLPYVLACINKWVAGTAPCTLNLPKVLAVINAWVVPIG